MTLRTNLSVLETLELFYEHEALGVPEGDFIKNQKQRNLKLPKLLHEFLAKYAYLHVNRGASQLWLPDKIDTDCAKVNGELQDIIIIGKLHNNLVALCVNECDQDNPRILLDELPEENGDEITLVFEKSPNTLEDLLKLIFLESPVVYDNTSFFETPETVNNMIKDYSAQTDTQSKTLAELRKSAKRPARIFCWDSELSIFVVLILNNDQEFLTNITPCFTLFELERIFSKEFYENAANCDFAHCLNLLQKIIACLERGGSEAPELGEKYQLAGRCCWALKRWNEAENYYKKAQKIFDHELQNAIEKVQNFYESLGIFYFDKEDVNKSKTAYQEADRLASFSGKVNARFQGNRLMRQATMMNESHQYQRAIDLYDQALAKFQKDPRDCRYEIARCQQLRSEAKRALKPKTQK